MLQCRLENTMPLFGEKIISLGAGRKDPYPGNFSAQFTLDGVHYEIAYYVPRYHSGTHSGAWSLPCSSVYARVYSIQKFKKVEV